MRAIAIGSALFLVGCFASHLEGEPGPGMLDAGPDARAVLDAGSDARAALDASVDSSVLPDDWYEDTLGWRVRFDCRGDLCLPPFEDAPPDHPVECVEEGAVPFVATAIAGRVVTLIASCDREGRGWAGARELHRPIVCRTDATCARLQHVTAPPRCIDGICQVPEEPLRYFSVLPLCMAYAARPERFPLEWPLAPELERAWALAGEACPERDLPCEVPPECAPR